MRHPTDGVLRRLLDEPAGVTDADHRHVAACATCASALDAIRRDAVAIDTALTPGSTHVDVTRGWQRLSAAAAQTSPGYVAAPPSRGRVRAVLRRPAAAVAFALVLTGAGAAAANDWLEIFRTERVAPVRITAQDLLALPDLSDYGDLVVTGRPNLRAVADAATARAETGLEVPRVHDLPRGVRGEPTIQVGGPASATFTFSTARATRAAAAVGKPLPTPPPGLDGSSVRLVAGPGVAQVWTSSAGAPALFVGRAVAPTAYAKGVPFDTLRDYLLTLPGLPPGVADQLRTFAPDGSTLPIPVPTDRFRTSSAEVGGVPATVLTTRDRSIAGVVWVDDGVGTVVAGSLDTDEVLAVARELR